MSENIAQQLAVIALKYKEGDDLSGVVGEVLAAVCELDARLSVAERKLEIAEEKYEHLERKSSVKYGPGTKFSKSGP